MFVASARDLTLYVVVIRGLNLVAVVRETLESRGVLGQLKAKIRAEVYHALDAQVRTHYTYN